jgi:hypothetical protein
MASAQEDRTLGKLDVGDVVVIVVYFAVVLFAGLWVSSISLKWLSLVLLKICLGI